MGPHLEPRTLKQPSSGAHPPQTEKQLQIRQSARRGTVFWSDAATCWPLRRLRPTRWAQGLLGVQGQVDACSPALWAPAHRPQEAASQVPVVSHAGHWVHGPGVWWFEAGPGVYSLMKQIYAVAQVSPALGPSPL